MPGCFLANGARLPGSSRPPEGPGRGLRLAALPRLAVGAGWSAPRRGKAVQRRTHAMILPRAQSRNNIKATTFEDALTDSGHRCKQCRPEDVCAMVCLRHCTAVLPHRSMPSSVAFVGKVAQFGGPRKLWREACSMPRSSRCEMLPTRGADNCLCMHSPGPESTTPTPRWRMVLPLKELCRADPGFPALACAEWARPLADPSGVLGALAERHTQPPRPQRFIPRKAGSRRRLQHTTPARSYDDCGIALRLAASALVTRVRCWPMVLAALSVATTPGAQPDVRHDFNSLVAGCDRWRLARTSFALVRAHTWGERKLQNIDNFARNGVA